MVPIIHEATFMRQIHLQSPIVMLSLIGATLAEAHRDPNLLSPALLKIAGNAQEAALQLMLPYIVSSQEIPLEVFIAGTNMDAMAGNNQHSRLVDRWLGFTVAALKQRRLNFEEAAPPSFSSISNVRHISTWLEQEQRRRVLWRLYSYDRASALQTSRTIMLTDEDCRVRLPCSDDIWNKEYLDDVPSHESPLLASTLQGLIDQMPSLIPTASPLQINLVLASILGHASQYYYSGYLFPGSPAQTSLLVALTSFWRNSPPLWKNIMASLNDPDWWKGNFDTASLYGLLVYHGLEVLARSPWELPRQLRDADWISSPAFGTVIQYAENCSHLLKGILKKSPDLEACPPHFGFVVVVCASVSLVVIKRNKSDSMQRHNVGSAIHIHIHAMESLGKRWNVAGRLSLLLKAALETDWLPSRGSFEGEEFVNRQPNAGEALIVLADLASAHKDINAAKMVPPPMTSPWSDELVEEPTDYPDFDLDRLLEGDGLETFLYSQS
jgi:hypothetical protein